MNEEQLQALMSKVAEMLNQASPEEVIQVLVQQGLPQEQATQLVQEVQSQMQSQGGAQPADQGGAIPTSESGSPQTEVGSDPNSLLDQVLQQTGPNILLEILEAYDALDPQGREAKKQQLRQMSNNNEAQQGTEAGAQEEPAPSFGGQPEGQPGAESLFPQ